MLVCFLECKKLNFSCPPLEQMFFEQCLFDFFTENVQMWIFTHNMFVNLQLHRNSINFLVDLTARKWDLFFLQSRCWESWPKCEKQLKPKETLPRCLSHDFLFGCFMGHLYKSHEDIYVPWDNPRFWSIKSKKVPASNRFGFSHGFCCWRQTWWIPCLHHYQLEHPEDPEEVFPWKVMRFFLNELFMLKIEG